VLLEEPGCQSKAGLIHSAHGGMGAWRLGEKETRRQGEKEKRRKGDKETRGQGDNGTGRWGIVF